MSTLHLNFREGKRRALMVFVTVLSLIAGFVAVNPPAANADINTGIKVTDLKLSASDQNGNPIGPDTPENPRQIDRNTAARLDFNWDASQTLVNAGDSFEIEFPEALFTSWRNYDKNALYVDYNGEQVQVGECSSTEKKIECVFNEKVDELNSAGYRGIKGEGWAVMKVLGESEGPTVDFKVNGDPTKVALPGGKIGPIPGDYYSMGFGKMSAYLGPDSKNILWDINFNSTHVQNLLNGKPEALTLDGTTSETITFEDILGPGQKFNPDTSGFYLSIRNSKDHPALIQKPLAFVSGSKDKVATEYGEFTIKFDQKSDTEGTFTVTGPFAKDTNYKIVYTSVPTTDDGLIVRDHDYYNESTIKGSPQKAYYSRKFSQSFDVIAQLLAGFGSFDLTKKVTGPQAGDVPADSAYVVNLEYTLPNGSTAADHPTWRPVGDLNDAKTGGTASMTVKADQLTKFTGQFPAGTVIKLSEERSTMPNGITWREPVFKVDGAVTDSITVGELKRSSVELTNEVAQIDVQPKPNPDGNDGNTDGGNNGNTDGGNTDNSGNTGNNGGSAGSGSSNVTGSSLGSSISPWWLLLGLIPLAFLLPHGLLKNLHPAAQQPAPAAPAEKKEVGKGI